jgi:hypothetical protein
MRIIKPMHIEKRAFANVFCRLCARGDAGKLRQNLYARLLVTNAGDGEVRILRWDKGVLGQVVAERVMKRLVRFQRQALYSDI